MTGSFHYLASQSILYHLTKQYTHPLFLLTVLVYLKAMTEYVDYHELETQEEQHNSCFYREVHKK